MQMREPFVTIKPHTAHCVSTSFCFLVIVFSLFLFNSSHVDTEKKALGAPQMENHTFSMLFAKSFQEPKIAVPIWDHLFIIQFHV